MKDNTRFTLTALTSLRNYRWNGLTPAENETLDAAINFIETMRDRIIELEAKASGHAFLAMANQIIVAEKTIADSLAAFTWEEGERILKSYTPHRSLAEGKTE